MTLSSDNKQRIQKILAAAGYGSRRACEELVLAGLVEVNGEVRDELPVLVDPRTDDIRIEGRRLKRERLAYFLLNKPKGVLCTNNDPDGRRVAGDLLVGVRERVYPVGRLDADSTGLLLMTNDGEMANRLTHPRYGVEKTYVASIRGRLNSENSEKLRKGIWLSEGKATTAAIRILHNGRERSTLEIRLREGRNRQIRRMLARLGHKIISLRRTRIGPLNVKGLGAGRFRPLTPAEIGILKRLGTGRSERRTTGRPHEARGVHKRAHATGS